MSTAAFACVALGFRAPARWKGLAVVAALIGAVVLPAPAAFASFPQLNLVMPRGVQRGADRELLFQGARLKDAEELLFHAPSGPAAASPLVVRSLTAVDDNSFKATVFVPEDYPLGEQLVQVRCKSGVSDFRSFRIGALPVVEEKEPNGSLPEAQPITLNSTVHGVVENEDVDLYSVPLQKGQRLAIDVEALRLGSHLFDPAVSVLDAKRFEVATADDSPVAQQDGVLSFVAPEDGTYYVQVRETSYAGDGNCRYRLHVGTFPRPTAVYPAGGKAGETVSVTFLGDAAGPLVQEVVVPATGSTLPLLAKDGGGICPTPIPFRITPLGNLLEVEPNDTPDKATTGESTLAFNGVIASDGDVDCFRFAATKGQVFEVECFARRIRSGLDPVVNVLRADGGGIAGNDDSRGPDSYLRFEVPEDGQYVIRVTDHLARGRSDFVYRVELQPVTPSLALSIPRIDRYSQTRQQIMVPRGNRYAVLVNAARTNFGGDLVLEPGSLPAGMTAVFRDMPAAVSQMPVVFEAAADAPIAGGLMSLEARPKDENIKVRGAFENFADFVLGQPNNAVYYGAKVDKLAVAVVEPLPFHLEIVQPQAPLARNGTMNLKVVVRRAEGFVQPVTVEFPFRSPGIGAAPSITIAADQTEGLYTLNADGNAALGTWPVYCIAQADAGGPAWAASQMATLEVVDPYVATTLARASCEQGQVAQIVCTFEQKAPFDGEGIARLQGLPAETSADEMKFTKDTTELVFQVKTSDKSPVGNHKTPFVEMVVSVRGEPVTMRGGSTEWQLAAPTAPPPPPPAPVADAGTPAAPPPPAPQPEKPLSRLEKLRLQGKQAPPAAP
jgi:hypothetical protein